MSKSRLSRFKKIVLCFSVVLSLCFTNFALFSVRASANSFPIANSSIYTAGAPVTLEFTSLPQFGGSGDKFTGSLSSFNVYSAVYSSDFAQTDFQWYGSFLNQDSGLVDNLYSFYYSNNPQTSANFVFTFLDSRRATLDFSLNSPVVFLDRNDFYSNFNIRFSLFDLVDLSGNSFSSSDTFQVTYTYIFADYADGNVTIKPITNTLSVTPVSSGTNLYLMSPTSLTNSQLSGIDTFNNSIDGNNYYILLNASISISGAAVRQIACEVPDRGSSYTPTRFIDFQTFVSSRMLGIFDSEYIQDNVVFEDISWTGWLVNAVSGFMDFELVPGLSFAGMLGLIVGMTVFIAFLKVFAGG